MTIESWTIKKVTQLNNGYIYHLNRQTSNGEEENKDIYSIYYDNLSIFMSNHFGVSNKQKKGKTLFLAVDNDKVLAVITPKHDICVVENQYTYQNGSICPKFGKTTEYIKENFGSDMDSFTSEIKTQTLSLTRK